MSGDQNKRIRVVAADDNTAMRDTVVRLLERSYEVVEAVSDGRSLVEAVSRLDPDVAVVDISMPILNGISAARQIRKHNSNIKIVFLTVNEDREFVQAAFEVGASAYVVKRQMEWELIPAIAESVAGGIFVSAGIRVDKPQSQE